MEATRFALRRYRDDDEDAAIELWRRTWQRTYPQIDFTARLPWWRERWRNELVPVATITVGEGDGGLVGFVTVDEQTGYLDQLVVAPEAWGSPLAALLLGEAKRMAPAVLDLEVNTDNARAVRFYQKHGFIVTGGSVNRRSGAPLFIMRWRP